MDLQSLAHLDVLFPEVGSANTVIDGRLPRGRVSPLNSQVAFFLRSRATTVFWAAPPGVVRVPSFATPVALVQFAEPFSRFSVEPKPSGERR